MLIISLARLFYCQLGWFGIGRGRYYLAHYLLVLYCFGPGWLENAVAIWQPCALLKGFEHYLIIHKILHDFLYNYGGGDPREDPGHAGEFILTNCPGNILESPH